MEEIEKKEVEVSEAEEASETEETETDSSDNKEDSEEASKETKPKLSAEALLAIHERQAKKLRKELGLSEEKPKKKSESIDYAQEAYFIAQGVKEADEKELVKDWVANTGKSLIDAFENKFLLRDLEGLREAKAVKLATPSNSKRTGTSATDTVDYWKAKIESGKATLLDIPDVKLRRKIVNSKLETAKGGNHFTDNPFGTTEIR